ncbi:MAG TPA: ABC transporter ATP-binding protein [Lacunisphaera sp.]|jgi:ATP-binding cassette subfamily B protein|nr:ABC transporter ATP-binding protein [Lacunisphaera sp.]
MSPPGQIRDIGLVRRPRDDDEEDEELQRPLEWGLIRRLFTYTAPIKGKVAVLGLLTLIRSAQLPALGWVMSLIIKGPITAGDLHALALGVLGYGALAVSTDFLFHFRQRYALEIGETVVNGLRAELYAKTLRQPMSFFHRVKLGRIIGRVTSDVESVRTGIQDVLFVSVIQFGSMVFSAAVMWWSDAVLFLVVLALAPLLWLINRHFRGQLSRHSRASSESFSRVTATLAESVNGMRVTQGFVRQETNAGLFRRLLADHARYNIALARTSAILTPLLELNTQFFVALLLLVGGWRVFHGDMSTGSLITFFLLANQFFAPIAIIGNQYNQALLAMAGAERVFRLIDVVPDWTDDPAATPLPDPRDGGGVPPRREDSFPRNGGGVPSRREDSSPRGGGTPPPRHGNESPRAGGTALPPSGGLRVEFRHVTFGYDPARPVLHDISFTAAPGQTVALVGHTGSGKSSIINLAAKFHLATRGEVLVDGREIRTITSRSLHRQMGMVQQQNVLFSGTVLDNIRLSRPEATDAEVRAAAAALDCLDLLEALPAGLQTEVGEKGGGLSVGQRQLVCFTRAMLADPRLFILDEATSAIDALTEARLQTALQRLLAGRTSFVVAHRLSTIRTADLVLVLDQGRIIERGTHVTLLAARGKYAALYRQFVQVDERA